MKITKTIAQKVLTTVDAGLVNGVGNPELGKMCVEAAVCYALGLPHGDDPQCVSRELRSLKIRLNDSNWSSNQARAKGLRRLALVQLGSAGELDDKEFTKRVAELAIRTCVPTALRAAASTQKGKHHAAALNDAALLCEKEGTRESALKAKTACADAYAACACACAYAAAAAAAYAAAACADAYAYAYADACAYAADACAYACAADACACACADAYAYACAYAYADADAEKKLRDKVLSDFAEGVVQILIGMKVPGCKWLPLTES